MKTSRLAFVSMFLVAGLFAASADAAVSEVMTIDANPAETNARATNISIDDMRLGTTGADGKANYATAIGQAVTKVPYAAVEVRMNPSADADVLGAAMQANRVLPKIEIKMSNVGADGKQQLTYEIDFEDVHVKDITKTLVDGKPKLFVHFTFRKMIRKTPSTGGSTMNDSWTMQS